MAFDSSEPYWRAFGVGLLNTLRVSVVGIAFCTILGTLIGVGRVSHNALARGLGYAYTELFRNIPLLVQMFLWYFVLPELLSEGLGNAVKAMPPPWGSLVPAVLCLGTFMSVRVAEQVRSGIQSLPRGQQMAGLALGLTRKQTYRYVLLPMVFRIILPPLSSEFLNTIKNSSLALTIGLMELTARARAMQEFSFQVFEAFAAATLIYLVVNLLVVLAIRKLERHIAVPGFIAGHSNPTSAGH
ncbi:MAG: amino acid ABC transporter permease [Oxalobacteraceae bacterium]|nr:amino acid ABC transporter permease [Oxalobacteraceae bacterium]